MLLVSVVQVRGMHRDGSDVGGIVIVVVAAAVIAVAAFRLWRTRAG